MDSAFRFKPAMGAHRRIRTSGPVQAEIDRRAQRVARAAAAAAPAGSWDSAWRDLVSVSGGRGRARTIVSTRHARRAEGADRSVHAVHLLRGLRAARD